MTLTLRGSNFQNVEVFRAGALVARATLSPDLTTAVVDIDTRQFTNGQVTLTAHAWNSPAGTTTYTSEADAGNLVLAVNNTTTRAPAASWWSPQSSQSWDLQLTGTVDTRMVIDNYGVDLFDIPSSSISTIKSRGGKVMCYFSAGTAESWRSDIGLFNTVDKGQSLDEWNSERWVDTRAASVRAVMASRLDLAVSKGCDAVLPGNVDSYLASTGKPLSASTQLDYNRWLAAEAHARGLGVALMNDVGQLGALAPSFDFAVNARCHEFNQCAGYSASFIQAGKVVYNFETAAVYINNPNGERDAMCRAAVAQGMNTQLVAPELDGSISYACR